MEARYSKVNIRSPKEESRVKLGRKLVRDNIANIIEKWQSLLDVTTSIAGVPSGLIMQLKEETIEVFVKSNTSGNPYIVGEEARLIYGLYCESVIGKQKKLVVPDATKNEIWKDGNPDIDLNMVSYLGMPINWPDNKVFGTVCLLDNRENKFSQKIQKLLLSVKDHIESDLQLIVLNEKLNKKNQELEDAGNIRSKLLSLISHDLRGNISSAKEFLRFIIDNTEIIDKKDLRTYLTELFEVTESTYLTLENILEWSKNDLLKLEANKTETNLVEVIESVLTFLKHNIELKELDVIKEFYADEVLVIVDRTMFEAALRNILSNAVKYSESKSTIYIRIIKEETKKVIEIEDTGIGMDEKAVQTLFEYDHDRDQSDQGGLEGSGIGLLLTKDFLDKNDARVFVISKKGKGTKFKIVL